MRSRLVVVCWVAAALAGCGGSDDGAPAAPLESSQSATPLDPGRTTALSDRVFETAVPAGWHRRLDRNRGERFYFLNSGPGFANRHGFAKEGEVGLTVAVQPSSDLPHGTSAREAFERIVATPENATGVARKPVTATRLDGAQAAAGQFTYKYRGRSVVQSNIVALGKGVVVFIEVDADREQLTEAQRVLATVVENWRWSEGAAVVPS
jgi:hypothetical protein